MFQFEIDESLPASKNATGKEDNENEFKVGDKIRCEKYSGEIKYIGAVNPHAGVWLGVEWDDPSRGKHSGSVDGVEYFKSNKHNSASFIRPHKAKKAKTIVQALYERYNFDHKGIDSMKDIDNRLEKKKIEFSELKIVDLCSRQIDNLDNPKKFAELCPNVQFLDIADNMITSWNSIADLCGNLHRLKGLDLSNNLLTEPTEEEVSSSLNSFKGVQHLILGKVAYEWEQVIKTSGIWTQLKNLQLQYNNISTLSSPSSNLLLITSLDLEGNKIKSWDEVIKLTILERLEYLNLCGNKINHIHFHIACEPERSTPSKTLLFSSLERLNISENAIASWTSVGELNKLQRLSELRIEGNPFLISDTRVNNRQWAIARIGNLTKFEGGEINRQERRDAEIDYVKKYSSSWRAEGTDIKFGMEHPRFAELAEKFGLNEEQESDTTTKSMRCNLITLNINPDNSNLKSCQKKIIHTMSVQKLKALLQRTFKTARAPTEIKLISLRNPSVSFILENDFFDLSQYSVEDGDTLIIRW